MPSYARDIDIGTPSVDTPVTVESNSDVVNSLTGVVDKLNIQMSEQRELQQKTQAALSFLLGQEIDTEE